MSRFDGLGCLQPMRMVSILACLLLATVGCGDEFEALGEDGGTRDSGGATPPVCGGISCAEGQECCLLDFTCFDPTDSSACAVPPDEAGLPGACASNADCAEGEVCQARAADGRGRCGGDVGECVAWPGPEGCVGDTAVCGCDGRTYGSRCEAAEAGVRVAWFRACGTSHFDSMEFRCAGGADTCGEGWFCDGESGRCVEEDPLLACGLDEQCRGGQFCCATVGLCFDVGNEDRCFSAPEGTDFPCVEDADCRAVDPTPPVSGASDDYYCDRPRCAEQGGCRRKTVSVECSGELEPVCGCDGATYTNACWASEAGVSVASAGECPETGA